MCDFFYPVCYADVVLLLCPCCARYNRTDISVPGEICWCDVSLRWKLQSSLWYRLQPAVTPRVSSLCSYVMVKLSHRILTINNNKQYLGLSILITSECSPKANSPRVWLLITALLGTSYVFVCVYVFRFHRSASCGKRQPYGGRSEFAPLQSPIWDLPDLWPADRTQEQSQDDLL